MPLDLKSIDRQKVGFFRFKRLNGRYLLTNDVGDYCFLDSPSFEVFLAGKIEQTCPDRYSELQAKGFIRDRLDFDGLARKYASKNIFLNRGPSLHIIVVTLRCDHKCIYCHASAKLLSDRGFDMDIQTAQKVVDMIFESPNDTITIEFQGGEPLVNFDTVKFIITYAKKRNKVVKKKLLLSLVTNLSLMSQGHLDFLLKNEVVLCTSLDGPEALHNKHRVLLRQGDSYKNTISWIKKIQKQIKKNGTYGYKMNALSTITRFSLPYYKQIVDEFVGMGFEGIHLRLVTSFGLHNKIMRKHIWPSSSDFLDFYKKALEYIINLNLKGINFYERTAKIFLTKILTDDDPNFLDIRSPCGAGIGQLAYNYNGDVYSCDEGRMLAVAGDETFKVGNVNSNSTFELINNETVKALCLASFLDNLPVCTSCVYKPYCGVCPVYNYLIESNIFSRIPENQKCKIHQGVLDHIFIKLKEGKNKEVFLKWLKKT